MKNIYFTLFIFSGSLNAAVIPPQEGVYTSKIDGENYCAAISSDGNGYYLYSDFGTDYCLANNKETTPGNYSETNQFRCINNYSSTYSEGFIGTFTGKSFAITGTSDIISNSSGPIEQSDYSFKKKYTFKLDTKGLCGSARATKSPEINTLNINSKTPLSRKNVFQ